MKDSHLTLRLPADLARALDRWARLHRVPKSQVAREAVARYLSHPGSAAEVPVLTARELAERWRSVPRLTPEEAGDLAADIAAARDALPAAPTPWE